MAHDGEAEGPTGTSPVATVQNALPVVASVTLSPSAPAAGDTLSASVSGLYDDDGDTITAAYAWTVDGALVSTATTLSSGYFAKHQDVLLTITPNDGLEDGLPVASAVATVVNTPPSYTALTTSPADAALGGSLTALPTGWADPDGDAVGYLYAWTVDGVAAGSAATLDLAPYSRGAQVELTATAWDGDDPGTVLGLGPLTLQSLLTAADASSKLLGDMSELAGSAVALTADITGDTFPDCIVGSPAMLVSGGARGGVNLISHPTAASIDMDLGVLLSGQAAGHLAGQTAAAAGDTNADGRPDLLVGAPGESTYAAGAGAAYLLPGPISTSFTLGTSGRSLYGRVAGEAAGSALAGGGDLDDDGYDDLAVGAPSAGDGAVYLIFGPVTTSGYLDGQDAVITGAASGDQCGFALASVGDTDGDGLDDLLLGAPGADGTGTDRGAAYLLAGADLADGDAASLALGTLSGEADWDFAGYSVAGPGDVDGDGYQDLLVGSRWQDAGGSGSGAVYLVLSPFTGALDLGSADAVLQGSAASENAGTSLAGAGDLDGDGADDFLVGAPGRAGVGASAGAVYVIAGLPAGTLGLSEAAWARIDAATTGDKLGQAVTGGVDVDLDGTPDLLVGAPYEDGGGTSAGAAYLFSGADL